MNSSSRGIGDVGSSSLRSDPRGFSEALRMFPTFREAAQWMGAERKNAKTMANRDWVPERYWAGLVEGLEFECGVSLDRSTLERWAEERGKWTRTPRPPADWSNLPDLERRIKAIVQSKVKDGELAAEAAGFAVLQMMEYAKPHLGYGVVCAFNYLKQRNIDAGRTAYLDDEEARQALDVRLFTPPCQEHRVAINDVFAAAELLPERYKICFRALWRGDSTELVADALGVAPRSVGGYLSHTRKLLREIMALADGSEATKTGAGDAPGMNP